MASGHVNRIKRPNTWLHRPMLQNVKKVLANTEPSTHGTLRKRRWRSAMSVHTAKADAAVFSRPLPAIRFRRTVELAIAELQPPHPRESSGLSLGASAKSIS